MSFGEGEVVEADPRVRQNVKYHVSNFLKDRHPYQPDKSFEVRRARDAGKVFNGLLPMGLDALLASLSDDSIDTSQRAIALGHLLGHSVACEQKVVLLRKGIVPVVASLLGGGGATPQIELLCCQLLRSLCIIPQGCHLAVVEGALLALNNCIANRNDAAQRVEARTAAVAAVVQMCSDWDGRGWILGVGPPPDTALVGYTPQCAAPLTANEQDALAQGLCDALVLVLDHDVTSLPMVAHAQHALALLTTDEEGLNKALIAGVLRATSGVLSRCAADDSWFFVDDRPEAGIALHAATTVWHVALDDVGKRECERREEAPLVPPLGRLVASVLIAKPTAHPTLKAALAGALCALMLHPPMKGEALAPLPAVPGERPVVELLLDLLRQTNALFDPLQKARKSGAPAAREELVLYEATLSLVKNCVQAVRLISELPRAVDVLLRLLPESERSVRRQLFVSTQHEQRFGVSMYD